jgi:hypothetical protein
LSRQAQDAERARAAMTAPREKATTAPAAPQAAAAGAETSQSVSPTPPAEWITRIRSLLQDGERARAREELARFRRAYPAYALPDDLRTLAR